MIQEKESIEFSLANGWKENVIAVYRAAIIDGSGYDIAEGIAVAELDKYIISKTVKS